ncbi:MAG TPA: hypothetical protein VJT31_14905 [Rugosimonospora sp.]|nr:hypothetical protein [Rugosimonospora sp.]
MPLAILDDTEGRGDPWRRPSFLRGSEQPVLERGENLLVRMTDCTITLETRAGELRPWESVWYSRRPGQATVTDRRVVVGCRRYDRSAGTGGVTGPVLSAVARAAGYRRPGKCLGGHFRYEWVADVAVALGTPHLPSHLMLTVTEPWLVTEVRALSQTDTDEWTMGGQSRQWRLSVGSVAATAYLPDLVALVANQVAQAHRRGAGPDADLGTEAELSAAEGWPQLRPEPGATGSVHIPGACALGTRPVAADDRAWRA